MRREAKQQSYIDWLKSIGCLVYLPLSADGDLQDRISGLSLQLTGNGSLVWDNAEQRYKITTHTQNSRHVATLSNGLTKTDFPDNKFSILQRIKKITNSTKYLRAFCIYSYNSNTTDAFNCGYNANSRSNVWPDGEHCIGTVFDANVNRRYYQDGTLYNTYSPYSPYLPSNWVLNGTGVIIGNTTGSQSFTGVQLYASELYLFNTALDLQTIRKIQGYE